MTILRARVARLFESTSLMQRFLLFSLAAVMIIVAFGASMTGQLLSLTTLSVLKRERGAIVEQRADLIAGEFETLRNVQMNTRRQFDKYFNALNDDQIEAIFHTAFRDNGDGTYRTRDEMFFGGALPSGDDIFGVGGFIAPGPITATKKRALVAALVAINKVGTLSGVNVGGLWFFTPDNDLIIFAPERNDQLIYYRQDAPADFDFQYRKFARDVTAEANPDGVMLCQGLSQALWLADQPHLVSGCVIPVRRNDRQLGAFGSTLMISEWFAKHLGKARENEFAFIADQDGELIAAPGLDREFTIDEANLKAANETFKWDTVKTARYAPRNRDRVVEIDGTSYLILSSDLTGVDWSLTYLVPAKQPALFGSFFVGMLVMILFVVAAIAMALVLFVRQQITQPLEAIGDEHVNASEPNSSPRPLNFWMPGEIKRLQEQLRRGREEKANIIASLERRVRLRTQELRQERDRANEATEAKTAFLANMSHEIRTPLNGVIGVADALQSTDLDDRQAEMIDIVRESGRTLERVLNDILDIAKVESGQLTLHPLPVKISDVLQPTIELMQFKADAKGLRFNTTFDDSVDTTILTDDIRIKQIVTNLLSNAIKFTDAGSVTVCTRLTDGHGDMKTLQIEVADTGIGMEPHEIERLFNRFEQADQSITRKYGGTGLGLAITKSIVSLMSGSIDVESTPGEGSRFTVKIPTQYAKDEGRTDRKNQALPADASDGFGLNDRRLQILVAEDNAGNRRVLEILLGAISADVTFCENGEQAVAISQSSTFDLILMDMQMPLMDGLSATQHIRHLEDADQSDPVPIIMLTANAMSEHVEAAHAAGCNLHLAKPVTPQSLFTAITAVMARPTGPEAEAA